MMHQCLVIENDIEDYRRLLSKAVADGSLENLEIHYCDNYDDAKAFISEAHIIFGRPASIAPLLAHAEKLQWVQSTFAGIEPFIECNNAKEFILTGVKDVFGSSMSEYVFGYIFAIERQMLKAAQLQKQSIWKPLPYRSLKDVPIGICGLGSIGQHLAKIAKSFGFHVSGLKSSIEAVDNVDALFTTDKLLEFVANQDYIINILPNTQKTKHLFDKRVFEAMKPECVFINIGRGATVNTIDLIDALNANTLKMAVLDVFEQEPLDRNSPLWSMDNVYITPHNSAVSFSSDVVEIFIKNHKQYIKNLPLHYVIDFNRGY